MQADAPAEDWTAVASSADGGKLVAVASDGPIAMFKSPLLLPPPPPSPRLSFSPSSGNFRLSWLVPSPHFALQQNSDLTTTNWADVPIAPALNFSTLHYEVILPTSLSPRFYRLKH